jgi:hypothetical protein
MDTLKGFFNVQLLSHPMNWLVVWLVATVWLLFFHVIMQGFKSMQGSTFNNGPLPAGNVIPPAQLVNGTYSETDFMGVPSYMS